MPDAPTETDIRTKAPNRGADTRERLLQLAEASVLEKGFGATSIEELIAAVGISKSGFFYHFKDKGALARAMLQRYLDNEETLFDDLFRRADELHEDPLHSFLIGMKMFAEMLADLPSGHPGCLVASYCYQEQLFDKEIQDLNTVGVLRWRARFLERFERIAERYPPKYDVDFETLADMVSTLAEGGIVMSKAARDSAVLPNQIMLYRAFVRSLFLGT